jgi:hypothetical protein
MDKGTYKNKSQAETWTLDESLSSDTAEAMQKSMTQSKCLSVALTALKTHKRQSF